jgi:Ca2+-dependent lipid-binding protein
LRIKKARNLVKKMNSYINLQRDGESAYSTRVQKDTNRPVWETNADIFVKNIFKNKIVVQIRRGKEDGTKNHIDDLIVGFWAGDVASIIGRKDIWLDIRNIDNSIVGQVLIDVGFSPVEAVLFDDSFRSKYKYFISSQFAYFFYFTDIGILNADIVEAENLEAVDNGGTSDPYCVVSMNDVVIHRTKTHKKNLNPVFNETISHMVTSRLRTSLNIAVRDFNNIGKHTTLGTVSVHLTDIKPDELQYLTIPLNGARGGMLSIRVFFDTDDKAVESVLRSQKSSTNDAASSRVDKAEASLLQKVTIGLGSSAVGSLLDIGDRMIGAPQQKQTGKTAEIMAKERGVPSRVIPLETIKSVMAGGIVFSPSL